MNAEQIFDKVRTTVEHIPVPDKGNTVVLFGAGGLGVMSLSALREEQTITAFCDNDKHKVGTMIEGLPCISPEQLSEYPEVFALICTIKYYGSIHQQLEQIGIRHCCLDAYIVRRHWSEFEAVFHSLDETSQRVYAGILLCRVTGDVSGAEKYFCGNQYFALPKFDDLTCRRGAFVDCGAFVGDTIEDLVKHSLGTAPAIYAFEPNDRSYAALRKRVAFLCDIWAMEPGKIVCEKIGIGKKYETLSFVDGDQYSSTQISHASGTTGDVKLTGLDEYLKRMGNPNIELIKADIESYEWDMLHGAKETIQRFKPQLAICIYHSIYDFFRIPLYLRSLVPEYRLAVRHHGVTETETVLYCDL